MQKLRPELPDPIECQGPDIKDECLFHIDCAIFFMSTVFMVPEFWKLLPDQSIGYKLGIFPKAENVEEFI